MSRLSVLTIAILILAGVGAGGTALRPDLGEDWGAPLLLSGYLVAGWMFLRGAGSYDGRERVAWRLIGGAAFLGAAGILAFGIASTLDYELPAFGPLDIFFLLAYVTNLSGFWVLPHLQGGPIRRARIFIDGMVGSISVAVVAWVWLLDEYLHEIRDSSFWDVVIGSSYPLFDIATLIVVMMVTLRRSSLRFDPRVLFLGAGFVAQAVADLLYLDRGLGQSFAEAEPYYPLYLAAAMCFLAASLLLRSRPPAREYAERRTPWWAMVAPYGAALVLIAMLVARMTAEGERATMELLVGAIVVVLLIIFRQALAIRETRELVERQRTALVSSISHELRTPLTAMVGFLDILADPHQHIDDEARQELIGIVSQQATYMARIVSDLVMLNRAEPDLGLQQRVVDVDGVVASAVSSLDLDSGSGVVTEVEPELAAHLDPDRIHQALVNLLTNAARYGGPNRLVVARRDDADVIFEVHDDGPGVLKRYELMIWDRFERGAHRYDASIPGSGIGLALVAMLVKAHDGTVGYRRSERLGGACFSMVLPDRARSRIRQPSLEPVGPRDP